MNPLQNFEAMLAQGQDNALLRYSLGNEYFKLKDFAMASLHFEQAVSQNPDYSAAWKLYGKSLVALQQSEKAIEVYTQGIAVAERIGDKQAAKEMQVFLKRLLKAANQ